MKEYIIPIILTAVGSSGLWSFLQWFFISRSGKQDELKEIKDELKSLKQLINDNEAKACRIRIINFADKMKVSPVGHEAWLQVLRDIDSYETYCELNPTFKNSYAKLSIDLIKETYEEEQKR